jgi:HPt (histidine-containing phosphotransfer) domain-containing protein
MERMKLVDREAEIRARLGDITGPDPGADERALLGRLIRSYLSKTPTGVQRLGELLRGGDLDEVRDQAHSLKGSAANLGAHTLAAVFAEVEHGARDGVLADPDVILGRVGVELALVESVLTGLATEFEGQ